MTKALIFGASGFTGSHLVARLRASGRIIPFDARACGADLKDPASIALVLDAVQPTAVVNLAAISTVTRANPSDLFAVNAIGWLTLLKALQARRFPGRIVFASTANIYGVETTGPIQETFTPAPANHYGLSKLMAEHFTRIDGAGLDIDTTRPFNCIGVGQQAHFLVPKLVDHFRARSPKIETGDLTIERDFIDIRDVADAYERLLEASSPPRIVNISSGIATPLAHLVELLGDITGHRPEIYRNESFIRPNELRHQQGDTSRLLSTGFSCKYTLRDTLSWMLGGG